MKIDLSHAPAVAIKTFMDWYHRRKNARELADLDPAELARMAHDLNLNVADIVSLASQSEDEVSLLDRMMILHGIDIAEVRKHMPAVMRDLAVTCSRCEDRKMCSHDLTEGADAATCDTYCPNAEVMELLARK